MCRTPDNLAATSRNMAAARRENWSGGLVWDKNTFKPPKPRVSSGEGLDKDPAVFDAWKNEVIDYLDLLGIADDKIKVTILQYLVSNTAKRSEERRVGKEC